jgi:F0F1-type ATP synthase assembly protein I
MLVMMFTFIMSVTAFNVLVQKTSSLDALLPCVVLLAVVTGRVLQTRSEVRRIRDDGFSGADLYRGLAFVLAEREARRQQLRANAIVVAQRSRTKRSALALLVSAVSCIVGGLSLRTTVDGVRHTPVLGVLLVFFGLIGFGLGMALLLRNPLAPTADDRFMARVWMGPIGRMLFGIDAHASTTSTMSVRTTARAAVAPASVAAALLKPDNANARLDALEARVQKLEQR